MRAGALRHRITIEALFADRMDSSDEFLNEEWDYFAGPLSAEITPLSGRELIAAQAVQSKVTTRIRIRTRPGVVASMRAIHRSTVYDIGAVIPDPVSGVEFMTLLCSSGVNEG